MSVSSPPENPSQVPLAKPHPAGPHPHLISPCQPHLQTRPHTLVRTLHESVRASHLVSTSAAPNTLISTRCQVTGPLSAPHLWYGSLEGHGQAAMHLSSSSLGLGLPYRGTPSHPTSSVLWDGVPTQGSLGVCTMVSMAPIEEQLCTLLPQDPAGSAQPACA